jgi:hypothetical protein
MRKIEGINKKTPARVLIQRFEDEICFDCHKLETRVNRSDYLPLMLKRGTKFLKHIRKHLLKRFKNGGFHEEGSAQEDFFLAWGYVLFDFIQQDPRIKRFAPYNSKTPFGEQDMKVWAKFCYLATR